MADHAATGAAMRRRQRRLRAWLRHERLTVAMALAEATHYDAPRIQKPARAREGGSETNYTAEDRRTPPPEEPGTQYFDLGDESVPELSGLRPAALVEPRPQEGMRRHTGEAYELVLDPVVPQLDRDLTDLRDAKAHQFIEAFEVVGGVCGLDTSRGLRDVLLQAAEHQEKQREQEDGGARSSNKMGKKGKKRKRRKKKLPKG